MAEKIVQTAEITGISITQGAAADSWFSHLAIEVAGASEDEIRSWIEDLQ